MARDELLVIDRMYELLKWFLNHIAKFPRSHRYGLGARIEARFYAIFEGLIRAKYSSGAEKVQELRSVNLDLEVLRMLSRLAHELKMLPNKSHAYAARETNEVGKMVGGWLLQQQGKQRSLTSSELLVAAAAGYETSSQVMISML